MAKECKKGNIWEVLYRMQIIPDFDHLIQLEPSKKAVTNSYIPKSPDCLEQISN